jgi:hypothetical protein
MLDAFSGHASILTMSEHCPQREGLASGAHRRVRIGKPLSAVLMILILVRTTHTFAGEQSFGAVGPRKPDINLKPAAVREPLPLTGPMFDLPKTYQTPEMPAGDLFAAGNFRPRGHSLREIEAPLGAPEDLPMLHGTSMWDRLSDYRSHGRVRLLTIWEAGDNSVSLQAGKKGEPSLQWTSRSMNRGGATRGLFDRLVPGASRSSHPSARQTAAEASARTAKAAESALNGPNR